MALRFPQAQLDQMHAHACEGYPHEVVGILAGRADEHVITAVTALVNERADSPKNRYKVGGLALMRAETALTDAGLDILGYYHSHPDHPAQYSDFDRDHAWPNMSYVIVSVREGAVADTLSWRLREDRQSMDAESIDVVGA